MQQTDESSPGTMETFSVLYVATIKEIKIIYENREMWNNRIFNTLSIRSYTQLFNYVVSLLTRINLYIWLSSLLITSVLDAGYYRNSGMLRLFHFFLRLRVVPL